MRESFEMASNSSSIESSMKEVIEMYHDLNPTSVEELAEEPSPLEFMRFVANNRPFVVRGGIRHWKAFDLWDVAYFKKTLAKTEVQVAATPNGWADAPTLSSKDAVWYFAKPLERKMSFLEFLNYLQRPSSKRSNKDEIWYAQTQNDNLRGEYADICNDVDRDIRWASLALGCEPDAVNMWIGTSGSTTALHRDPYQNVFCQVVGGKTFVLIPPIEAACVNEQFLPPATWAAEGTNLVLRADAEGDRVPCAMWNPDQPTANQAGMTSLCAPMRVTLEPGDMMYLPAMWYHQVSQIEDGEGICCSVNYWYDMEYGGSFFPLDQLVRLQSRTVGRFPD